MVTIQNYVRAQSIDEAYELNQKKGSCIIGGMLWTKMQDRLIQTAIDMCDLGLDTIEEKDDEFIIGAMTSLRQIELHDGLNKYTHGAVCEAVKDIVGVQFRNLATIGGSIWGRFGFSDILTVFLAMDAFVELYHGGMIPLREFVNMKQDRDVIVHLIIRKLPEFLLMHQSAIREQIFLSLPVQHHAWMENTVWLWEQGLEGRCLFWMKKACSQGDFLMRQRKHLPSGFLTRFRLEAIIVLAQNTEAV